MQRSGWGWVIVPHLMGAQGNGFLPQLLGLLRNHALRARTRVAVMHVHTLRTTAHTCSVVSLRCFSLSAAPSAASRSRSAHTMASCCCNARASAASRSCGAARVRHAASCARTARPHLHDLRLHSRHQRPTTRRSRRLLARQSATCLCVRQRAGPCCLRVCQLLPQVPHLVRQLPLSPCSRTPQAFVRCLRGEGQQRLP